jgi:predicted phage terminase large subunit-like protein
MCVTAGSSRPIDRVLKDPDFRQFEGQSRDSAKGSDRFGSPAADKVMRLHAQSAEIDGFVHVPAETPWLADYVAELTAFSMGRHDDRVDSTP